MYEAYLFSVLERAHQVELKAEKSVDITKLRLDMTF